MSEGMDEVEDMTTKLERNPRTRTTGADVAEKSGAVVCEDMTTKLERNPRTRTTGADVAEKSGAVVFPLKSGEGSSAGGYLRILLLKTGEELIVEAKADRGYGISGEGVGDRILKG